MANLAYFRDGHTEEILYYVKYEEGALIEFHTVSGRYIYYEYLQTSIHRHVTYKTHDFYTSVLSADDFGYVEERLRDIDDIVKIVIEED